MKQIIRDLCGALGLFVLAVVMAWLFSGTAAREPGDGVTSAGEDRNDPSAPEFLSLEHVSVLARDGSAVIVDVRPESVFRRGHIPGAVSLPLADFEQAFSERGRLLPRDRPVVLYCASRACHDSDRVFERLRHHEYTNISIFRGGWQVWQQTGQPTEADAD